MAAELLDRDVDAPLLTAAFPGWPIANRCPEPGTGEQGSGFRTGVNTDRHGLTRTGTD